MGGRGDPCIHFKGSQGAPSLRPCSGIPFEAPVWGPSVPKSLGITSYLGPPWSTHCQRPTKENILVQPNLCYHIEALTHPHGA